MGRTAFGCGSLRGTDRRGTNRRLTPSTLPEACVTTASSTVSEPTGHFVQFDQFELIDSKCNECNPDYFPTANDHRAAFCRRTGRRGRPRRDGCLSFPARSPRERRSTLGLSGSRFSDRLACECLGEAGHSAWLPAGSPGRTVCRGAFVRRQAHLPSAAF